jgi:hypothetical protein
MHLLSSGLETKVSFLTAFHPEIDGQTERVNRVIEEALDPYMNARHTGWDLYLAWWNLPTAIPCRLPSDTPRSP